MLFAQSTQLGAGDCEAFGAGWLVQTDNAWSSLAYTVVGMLIIVAALRGARSNRALPIVFGALMGATGIGSFLYHGPQGGVAGFAHDITFLATLWFLVVMDPASAYGLRRRTAWTVLAAVIAANAIALLAFPGATNVLTGVAVVALVVSDLLMHRVGGIDGRWYAAALILLGTSLAINLAGRSDSPTCDPDALIQFHAIWHVLSAAGLGAYYVAMRVPRNQEPTP